MSHPRSIKHWLLIAASLALLVFAVYAPAVSFGLINFDDPEYAGVKFVRTGLSAENFRWAFTAFQVGNWHPLTGLSLQLDAAIYHDWYGGFHLTNILFHYANTLLVMLLFFRATRAFWPSVALAALFAVHPLHVESVAWVSERKDVLSTFFGLLALLAYVHHAARPSWRRMILVALALALGLLAKPMLVTWPAVMFLLDIWPLRRLTESADFPRRSVAQLIVEKIPLMIVVAGSIVATLIAQSATGAMVNAGNLPMTDRLANAVVSYVRYLGKTFWPSDLIIFYWHTPSPAWQVAGSAALLIAITAGVFLQRKNRPYLLCGWLWFLGTLIPVIGLVQVGGQAMADRYTYIPHIGLFAAIVWLAADLKNSLRLNGRAVAAAFVAVAIVLAFLAHQQVGYWRDSITVWSHALEVDPTNPRAHFNLGNVLPRPAQLPQAIEHYRAAISAVPNYTTARFALAGALDEAGKRDEAAEQLAAVVAIDPQHYGARINLAMYLLKSGKPAPAIGLLEEAARLNPGEAIAPYALGLAYTQLNRPAEAVTQFRRALGLDPTLTDAHVQLAAACDATGDLDQAMLHYNEALKANPNSAPAHNGLGVVFAKRGDLDTAVAQFKAAIAADPSFRDAHDNLAHATNKRAPQK